MLYDHRNCKVDRVASKDQTRPVLTLVHLAEMSPTDMMRGEVESAPGEGSPTRKDARRGWLQATNSYTLVRVPVVLSDDDTPGFIPADAVRSAQKVRTRSSEVEVLSANGTARVVSDGSAVEYVRPNAGQFPNVEQLIPPTITDPSATRCVTFNVKHLVDLAAALGAEDVTFTMLDDGFKAETAAASKGKPSTTMTPTYVRPIFVEAGRGGRNVEVHDGRHGLLMPIRATRR